MGILGTIRHTFRQKQALEAGLRAFGNDGHTPHAAFAALRGRHCATAGRATDELAAHLATSRPPKPETESGLLGAEHSAALSALQENGFYVFEQRFSPELCAELQEFARETPATLHPRPENAPEKALYDAQNPLCETYHFSQSDILSQSAAQNLVADVSLRNLARDYLGCEPIFDLAAMWWSAPAQAASSAAAQLYHFDMIAWRGSSSSFI